MANDTQSLNFNSIPDAYNKLSAAASNRTDTILCDIADLKDYLQAINDNHENCIGSVTLDRIDVDNSDSYIQEYIEANGDFDSLYSGLSTACGYGYLNSGGSVGGSGGSNGSGMAGDYTVDSFTPVGNLNQDSGLHNINVGEGAQASVPSSSASSYSTSPSSSFKDISAGGVSSGTNGGNLHTGASIGAGAGALSSLTGGLGGPGESVLPQVDYPLGNYKVNSSFMDGIPKDVLTEKLTDLGFTNDEINAIMGGDYDVSKVLVDELSDKLAEAYNADNGIRDYLKEQYGFDIFNEDGTINNDKLSLALYMDDKTGLDNYSLISTLSEKYGINIVDQTIMSNYTNEFESMFMKDSTIRKLFMEKYGFDIYNPDGTINKDRLVLAMLIDKKSNGQYSLDAFLKEAKSSMLVNSLGNNMTNITKGSKTIGSKLPYLAGAAAVGAGAVGAGIMMNKKKENNKDQEQEEENRFIKDFDFNNKQNDNNEQWVNKVINEKL